MSSTIIVAKIEIYIPRLTIVRQSTLKVKKLETQRSKVLIDVSSSFFELGSYCQDFESCRNAAIGCDMPDEALISSKYDYPPDECRPTSFSRFTPQCFKQFTNQCATLDDTAFCSVGFTTGSLGVDADHTLGVNWKYLETDKTAGREPGKAEVKCIYEFDFTNFDLNRVNALNKWLPSTTANEELPLGPKLRIASITRAAMILYYSHLYYNANKLTERMIKQQATSFVQMSDAQRTGLEELMNMPVITGSLDGYKITFYSLENNNLTYYLESFFGEVTLTRRFDSRLTAPAIFGDAIVRKQWFVLYSDFSNVEDIAKDVDDPDGFFAVFEIDIEIKMWSVALLSYYIQLYQSMPVGVTVPESTMPIFEMTPQTDKVELSDYCVVKFEATSEFIRPNEVLVHRDSGICSCLNNCLSSLCDPSSLRQVWNDGECAAQCDKLAYERVPKNSTRFRALCGVDPPDLSRPRNPLQIRYGVLILGFVISLWFGFISKSVGVTLLGTIIAAFLSMELVSICDATKGCISQLLHYQRQNCDNCE